MEKNFAKAMTQALKEVESLYGAWGVMLLNFMFGIFSAKSYTQFGWRVAMVRNIEPKDLKGGKSNPYNGRLQKISLFADRQFADYGAVVSSRTETGEYDTQDMGYDTILPRLVSAKTLKSGERNYYINMLPKQQGSAVKTFFLLDGKMVTEKAEIDAIRANLHEKKESFSKQLAAGVSEDRTVRFNRIKFDNVLLLSQGNGNGLSNLSGSIVITDNDYRRMMGE
jgi:hypothetical protein